MNPHHKKPVDILKIGIDKIKCPICGDSINWIRFVSDYEFGKRITLIAECWPGENNEKVGRPRDRHLFLIKLRNLPIVDIPDLEDT